MKIPQTIIDNTIKIIYQKGFYKPQEHLDERPNSIYERLVEAYARLLLIDAANLIENVGGQVIWSKCTCCCHTNADCPVCMVK